MPLVLIAAHSTYSTESSARAPSSASLLATGRTTSSITVPLSTMVSSSAMAASLAMATSSDRRSETGSNIERTRIGGADTPPGKDTEIDRIGIDTVDRIGIDTVDRIGIDTVDRIGIDTVDKVDTVDRIGIDTVDRIGIDTVDKVDTVEKQRGTTVR